MSEFFFPHYIRRVPPPRSFTARGSPRPPRPARRGLAAASSRPRHAALHVLLGPWQLRATLALSASATCPSATTLSEVISEGA